MRITAVLRQTGFRKWLSDIRFKTAGYNQYGLLYDDCMKRDDDTIEALRRLPDHVLNERAHRIIRALNLHMNRELLPESEWTKQEDDVRYLQSHLERIQQEKREKAEWYKQ